MDLNASEFEKVDTPSLEKEEIAFKEYIVGQDEAVRDFSHLLVNLRSGIRPPNPGPLDVLFLAGPSGVGKTEATLTLAKLLSDEKDQVEQKVITINGGEFQEAHTISRLFGSPPGYAGSSGTDNEIPPVLSQDNIEEHEIHFKDKAGNDKAVTIILVDEAEKANSAIHKTFLSVLDKGRLNLADNTSVDFSDTVIVFTSNIGNQKVEKLLEKNDPNLVTQEMKSKIISDAIGDKYPPELRGRMRKIIIFKNLSEDAVLSIAEKQIDKIQETFQKSGVNIKLDLSQEAYSWLAKRGYNTSEGARGMSKIIESSVFDQLVLIHNGMGLQNRAVHVDLEDDSLVFFTSKELLEDIDMGRNTNKTGETNKNEIDERILGQISAPLLEKPKKYVYSERTYKDPDERIEKYIRERDRFVDSGLIVSEEDANFNPRIKELGLQIALDAFSKEDIGEFSECIYFRRIQSGLVKAGIFTKKDLCSNPQVVEMAEQKIESALKSGSIDNYNRTKKTIVNSGIGDDNYWNNMFKDSLLKLVKN